jgi:hypothetical protein
MTEPDQPHDFWDVLFLIEFEFKKLNLHWYSPKVIDFIYRLHQVAGYQPPNNEMAIMALSYRQLETILKKIGGLRGKEPDSRRAELLIEIETNFLRLNLTWESERVVNFLSRIGNGERLNRDTLSYVHLKTLADKLKVATDEK